MTKFINIPDARLMKVKEEREKQGQKISINQSDTKYSEMLLDLIQPFLDRIPDPNDLFDMLDLGVIAWNTGNVKGISPEMYESYMDMMLNDKNVKKPDLDIFKKMIDRKVEKFFDHNYFIEDFELKEGKNGMAEVFVFCKSFEDVMQNGFPSGLLDDLSDGLDSDARDEFETGYINRNAITVKPKQPFFEWLNKLYPEDPLLSSEENNIYLIKEMDDNEQTAKWIKKNFEKLFSNELSDWHTNRKEWPLNRTYDMFKEWFDVEINSMIYDLEKYPVTKE